MVATKSNGDQNGFGCHLMVGTKSILFTIQQWQLNLVAMNGSPFNGAI
jgi:hypothetical protein